MSETSLSSDELPYIEELLGFGGSDAYNYFQFGIDEALKTKIEDLLKQRDIAKQNKDYALSDKIRDELKNMDISLMDSSNGTVWEKL